MRDYETKILIITGTYPPERCGVGDYTWNLLNSTNGSTWEILYSSNWKINTFIDKIKQIKQSKARIINVQYPTMGYAGSIFPHLLFLYLRLFTRRTLSITFHEFSQMKLRGKIAAYSIFILLAHKIIFTTEEERDEVSKRIPLIFRRKIKVIKIASNIPASTNSQRNLWERKYDIIYFGYIRPQKGIEQFIYTCKQLKITQPDLKIIVVGQVQKEFTDYAKRILKEIHNIGVEYVGNLAEHKVANLLSNVKIAFLPYPDGVSERRGSFLAAIINGCIVVTTIGKHTTKMQKEICFIGEKESFVKLIESLLIEKQDIIKRIQVKNSMYAANNIPDSWNKVKSQYEEFLMS